MSLGDLARVYQYFVLGRGHPSVRALKHLVQAVNTHELIDVRRHIRVLSHIGRSFCFKIYFFNFLYRLLLILNGWERAYLVVITGAISQWRKHDRVVDILVHWVTIAELMTACHGDIGVTLIVSQLTQQVV